MILPDFITHIPEPRRAPTNPRTRATVSSSSSPRPSPRNAVHHQRQRYLIGFVQSRSTNICHSRPVACTAECVYVCVCAARVSLGHGELLHQQQQCRTVAHLQCAKGHLPELTVRSTERSVLSSSITRQGIMFLLVGMRCDLIWLSTMSAAAALRPFLRLRNRNILDAFVGGEGAEKEEEQGP